MPQEPHKEELEWLQKEQIIVHLAVNETSEWCNSFVLLPNKNNKAQQCLDQARFYKMLIRPMHR